MSGGSVPELKQALGAMVFAADRALTVKEMRSCLRETARNSGEDADFPFGKVKEDEIVAALRELAVALEETGAGFLLREVAGGYRFQSDPACGPWLRRLLDLGQPRRLSWPALETLAIIAYRQPVTRAEIEGVRGVAADHMVRVLMEMQLVKIAGRSPLPGRPFTYGTTHTFLEHFGLKGLDDLVRMNPDLARPPEPQGPKLRQADWIEESHSAVSPSPEAEPEEDPEARRNQETKQEPEAARNEDSQSMEPGREGAAVSADSAAPSPREETSA
jgi:segregation and condensation protein B